MSNLTNFIEEYTISDSVCDEFLDYYHANKDEQYEVTSPDKSITATYLTIGPKDYNLFDNFFSDFVKKVDGYVEDYIFSKQGEQRSFGSWALTEPFNIQHYAPGQGYGAVHCERQTFNDGPRFLVWMLYLSDTPNAGTKWIHQDHTTECKKGSLVIWPSDFTHLHTGIPSMNDDKYIATGWVSMIPDAAATGWMNAA
jgi:hypothetical protein